MLQNQPGFSLGGPVVLPGFDGRNKAFFFFHYEQIRFPNSFTRTRNVVHPRALDGWFRYEAAGAVRGFGKLEYGDPQTVEKLRPFLNADQPITPVFRVGGIEPSAIVFDNQAYIFRHQN